MCIQSCDIESLEHILPEYYSPSGNSLRHHEKLSLLKQEKENVYMD